MTGPGVSAPFTKACEHWARIKQFYFVDGDCDIEHELAECIKAMGELYFKEKEIRRYD